MKILRAIKKISVCLTLITLTSSHLNNSVIALTENNSEIENSAEEIHNDSNVLDNYVTDIEPQIEKINKELKLDSGIQEFESSEVNIDKQIDLAIPLPTEITSITAETVPQTVWLGSDLSELELWDFVTNIRDQDKNEVRKDQVSIELITLPNTSQLTEGNKSQSAVIELSSKETSAKVRLSVPIEVIYGQTLMYGGISVSGAGDATPWRTGFAVTIHQKNNELFLVSSLGNGQSSGNVIHSYFPEFYLGLSAYRPTEYNSYSLDPEIQYYQYMLAGTVKVNVGVEGFGVNQKLDVQNGDIIQMSSAESGAKNGQFTSTTNTWSSGNSKNANYEVVNQSFRRLNLDLFTLANINQINLWENTTLEEANEKLKMIATSSGFDNIELVHFESLPDTTIPGINQNATIRIEETLSTGKKVYRTISKPINIVSPVSLTTTINNNTSIEIGDEFEVNYNIENLNQNLTLDELQVNGQIFSGKEAELITNSVEIIHLDKSVETIFNIGTNGEFKLNYSNIPAGGTLEVRYRMKAMELINKELAQELVVYHDTQKVSIGSGLEIKNGTLTFYQIPEVLEFKKTKLNPNMLNYVVERKDSDWGMTIRDTRSTMNLDNTELRQQDWYVTARAQSYFESEDGGCTFPTTNAFIGFMTSEGNNIDISTHSVQITEKNLITDTEYGERLTELTWKPEQGFNLTIADSHTIVPGKTYKNKVEFNLVVGP